MTAEAVGILVAEDNPSDAELIVQSLQAANITERAHIVRDGVEALEFLFGRGSFAERMHAAPPRLVLLDIKLPRTDGFEVLRELKENAATRAIPVVMFTSSNVERDVARCYELGANSYVQKPVNFDQFRQTVGQIARYWLGPNARPPRRAFVEAAS